MDLFFIGVLSSIVAAFIIYLVRYQIGSLLNFIFFKYFPNVSGKYLWINIRVPGDALDAYPNEKTYLYFKQTANNIKGYGEVFTGEKLLDRYSIRGKISTTRVLRFTCECSTTDHHDIGAGVFKLDAEGKYFKGIYIALCVKCENTTSCHVKLQKVQ
ncbi:MAG: hypothetical protein ACYDG5_09650 [Dehalococcoidales bacterium]